LWGSRRHEKRICGLRGEIRDQDHRGHSACGGGAKAELALDLACEVRDRFGVGERTGRGEVGAVTVQREGAVIDLLVCDDGLVEQSGREIRLLPQGGVEVLEGIVRSAAQGGTKAEIVEGFGGLSGGGIQLEHALKAALGLIDQSGAQLSGSKPGPAEQILGLVGGISGQFVNGCGQVVLLEEQAAAVVADNGQIEVPGEGVLVGLSRPGGLIGVMIGQAEEVPGLGASRGVGGEQVDRLLQRLNGFQRTPLPEQTLPFEQAPAFGRRAARQNEKRQQPKETSGDAVRREPSIDGRGATPLFDGLHVVRW